MNSKIETTFNQAADSYDENCHLQLSTGARLLKMLSQFHFTLPRIIDLGCGTGIVTEKLINAFQFQSFHAIDFADHLLKKAVTRLTHSNIQIYHADFDHLPKYDVPFDIIFSNMALHWSAHLQNTLKKILSQLSENGILAFAIPLHGTLSELNTHFAINSFPEFTLINELLKQTECEILNNENEEICLEFNDTLSALKSIKNIGANFVTHRSRSHLLGKSFINKVKLPKLTYHIGYFVVRKKEPSCHSNYLSLAPTQMQAKRISAPDC